jgi:steroid delta-isomerase-like uncharacterized protein
MSAQDTAALGRRFVELWNSRAFDEFVAQSTSDAEVVNMASGQTYHGPEGVRRYCEEWATAFPDARCDITGVVASESGVVVEFVGRGTHSGPLATPMGDIPATNRYAELPCCEVYDLRDGKLARLRLYFDTGTLLRQLGLVPESAAAPA